jgi:hypothetical protein
MSYCRQGRGRFPSSVSLQVRIPNSVRTSEAVRRARLAGM